MATALDPFSMFTLTTGPAFMTSSQSILNATLRHYYLLSRFMSGKPMEQILQGGSEIKDIIYLEQDSNAEYYRADDQQFSYRNQQVGTSYKLDWRMLANNTSWTDHEIGLNETGGMTQGPGTFHRFKYYRDLKMMNLWTTTIEKMEAQLFAQPISADMEAATGSQPYSIMASISDNADGVPAGGTWTTVQSINPSDKANWDNQRATYDAAGSINDNPGLLWAGMRTVYEQCKFSSLPRFGAYGKASTSPAFIACSLWGLIAAETALQSKQDLLMGGPGKDPAFNGPTFSGVPLVRVDSLDTGELWSSGVSGETGQYNEDASAGSGTGTTIQGPRFIFINGRCMNVIWHKNRMFHKVPPFHPDEEPFKKVLVVDNWYNVVNQNRREHGVLSPGTNVTAPASPIL